MVVMDWTCPEVLTKVHLNCSRVNEAQIRCRVHVLARWEVKGHHMRWRGSCKPLSSVPSRQYLLLDSDNPLTIPSLSPLAFAIPLECFSLKLDPIPA